MIMYIIFTACIILFIFNYYYYYYYYYYGDTFINLYVCVLCARGFSLIYCYDKKIDVLWINLIWMTTVDNQHLTRLSNSAFNLRIVPWITFGHFTTTLKVWD